MTQHCHISLKVIVLVLLRESFVSTGTTDLPSCLYNKYIEYMNMRILVCHVNICVRCMTMFGHTIILITL